MGGVCLSFECTRAHEEGDRLRASLEAVMRDRDLLMAKLEMSEAATAAANAAAAANATAGGHAAPAAGGDASSVHALQQDLAAERVAREEQRQEAALLAQFLEFKVKEKADALQQVEECGTPPISPYFPVLLEPASVVWALQVGC